MTEAIVNEAQKIAEAAREDFDLGERLRRKSKLTKTVRVFTDEVTGAEIGGAEIFEYRDDIGMKRQGIRKWGITGNILKLGETDELKEANAEEIAQLKEEVRILSEKLESTALIFTLRSVPPIVRKDAKRAAREAQGIHGKINTDDARWDDFADEYDAQLLKRVVVSIEDKGENKITDGCTIENARAMISYLDDSEMGKVIKAMNELLWQRQIADRAVEDADF